MIYIRNFFILIFLLAGIMAQSQDPHFSQFYSNPLALNPAFAGSAGCSRVAMNFRSQWSDLSGGGYKTSSISYDQYANKLKGGLGVFYMYDNAGGVLFTHKLEVDYAYNIKCSENLNIRPAVNIGIYRKSIDGSQFIPALPTSEKMYFNAGAGFLILYKKISGGFSLDHINQPNEGFYSLSKLQAKFTAHVTRQFNIEDKAIFTPIIIFQKQQKFEAFIPSFLFNISYIKFGAGLRFGLEDPDSFIGMIGFQNEKFSIGYSYDYTISKLTNATGGTHEISAVLKFRCRDIFDRQLLPVINNF